MLKKDFISLFKQETKITDLDFNEHNICCFIIDNTIKITLEWVADKALYVYSTVTLSSDLTPKQLLSLLHANAYGRGVGKGHLAIDEHTEEVILQYVINLEDIRINDVIDTLEDLISFTKVWRRELSSLQSQPTHTDGQLGKHTPANITLI